MTEQRDKCGRYAWVLLVIGVLGRLILMILPHPFSSIPANDASYIQAAQDILRLNFHALGDRVPVYPLLVALCGLNLRAVWVAQSLLTITASLMIFDMAFRRTRHAFFSLLVGLACSLIPEFLVYEASVGTEVLTNFLLVASLWLITRCDWDGENNIRYLLGLGSIVALAGLTRPLMMCLAPVYYCFLVPLWPPAKVLRREAIKRTLFYTLPVFALILGWCEFNHFNSGYFTPTTRAGQQLMDQVDPYVDLAPDRFAVLRDAWLQSRKQTPPSPNFTSLDVSVDIDDALPEMERRTGKTDTQIYHELAFLALYLQIHHPLLCLRRAQQGWVQFWGQPTSAEVDWPRDGKIKLSTSVNGMADFLVREIKAVFLVLALVSIPCAFIRLKAFTRMEYLIFAMALGASVFAAFTEFGDNRRFCLPFYMLIIYTVMTRGWMWIAAASAKVHGSTSY